MGLQYNGTNIYGVNYNGTSLTQINYNGVPVWYALAKVTISGVNKVGYEWTARTTPSEVQSLCTYQWYRGGIAIQGATKDTYTTTMDDKGYQLSCVAKIGTASATSNLSLVITQEIESISLSGVARSGSTITISIVPSNATGVYQWYRDDILISSASDSSYTQVDSDIGKTVKCVFTANGNYSGEVNAKMSSTTVRDDWSKSLSATSWPAYSPRAYTTYGLASNQVVTYVYCNATVYNHTSDDSETATVHAWITVGSTTKEGGTSYAGSGRSASSSCSWAGSAQGVSITIGNGSDGDSFMREASGSCSGYYIHN